MKKISLFIPSLNGGGAERVILILANELSARGYNVDLVLCKASGIFLKDVSKKINVVDLKCSRVLSAVFPLIGYLKKNNPDVIMSAMHYVNTVLAIAKTLSGVNTRLIMSEHSHLSLSLSKKNYKNFILRKLMHFMYRKADHIIAVSNGVANDLVKNININPNKVKVINNPVVTNDILIKKNLSLNHYIEDNNIPFILGVGRLTEAKNFSLLIKAFSIICKEVDVHLVILGTGHLEAELREEIDSLNLRNRVHLLGFMENPYNWMKKSELFVLSSSWEGFGNVLVESMACGTKVISTDCPSGPAEILDNGRLGVLVPVNDVDKLSKSIHRELINNNLRYSSTDILKYCPENIVDEYLEVLLPN